MSIRVIAGTAKGRRLKLVPGDSTRPIMDRVKESLFNIIGRSILDASFLDLFAGTGSVGIEALSRGASYALLTDIDVLAIQTIKDNLKLTGFSVRAAVRKIDAFSLLRQKPDRAYEFIYIAPPQYKAMWSAALLGVEQNRGWLHPDGSVIVQIDPTEYAPVELNHFALYDERRYGNTLLLFYHLESSQTEDVSRG
ncbi:MAG: 16S rRNA (guanine(966)-N(2))-methyltransferase RsmD [Anaerolineae bacterium]